MFVKKPKETIIIIFLGLNEKPLTSDNSGIAETRGIILTITLVAGVLLVLNVILISCYVRRKAKRNGNYYNSYINVCFFFYLIFRSPYVLCVVLHGLHVLHYVHGRGGGRGSGRDLFGFVECPSFVLYCQA